MDGRSYRPWLRMRNSRIACSSATLRRSRRCSGETRTNSEGQKLSTAKIACRKTLANDSGTLRARTTSPTSLSSRLPRGRFSILTTSTIEFSCRCWPRAGIRKIRLHHLRHTFGSQLLQNGASIVYVKEQMGHSSIQVTVDTYGHLIPGADINWIDGLDRKTSPQQNATPAQLEVLQQEPESLDVVEKSGERGRNRTYNLLIKSRRV